MKINRFSNFSILFLGVLLSGCNPAIIKYQFDPDTSYISQAAKGNNLVSVKVLDKRKSSQTNESETRLSVSGDLSEAKLLRSKLIKQLKEDGFKIINNDLLADIAFSFEIERLDVNLETKTFKSTVRTFSKFKLTVSKQGEHWSKIFNASRTQEVANPANDLDASGVINQLLSEQMGSAFTDQGLINFLGM